jgi:hypothetical protein
LYEELKTTNLGRTVTKDYSRLTNHEAVFIPSGYKNAKELEQMRVYAFRKFYLRPRYLLSKISSIHSFLDVKRYIRGLSLIIRRYVF